jgi:hypothetical protein
MSDFSRKINIYVDAGQAHQAYDKLLAQQKHINDQIKKYADAGKEIPAKLTKQLETVNGALDRQAKKISGELSPTLKELNSTYMNLNRQLSGMSKEDAGFEKKKKETQAAKAELDKYKKSLLDVQTQMKDTGNRSEGGGLFGGLIGNVEDIQGAFSNIGQSAKALFSTLLANPIGIVIASLVGLGSILKSSAFVSDELSFAMSGLKSSVRAVADSMVDLGRSVVTNVTEKFKDAKFSIAGVGEFLKERGTKYIEGFGKTASAVAERDLKGFVNGLFQIATTVENVGDKVAGFGKKVGDTYSNGSTAARQLDQLVSAQGLMTEAIAKNNRVIEDSKTILLDKTKGDEARMAAAKSIIELENSNAQKRVEIASKDLAANELMLKGKEKSGEEEKRLSELRAAVIDAETQAITLRRRAEIRLNNLLAESAQEATDKQVDLSNNIASLGDANLKRQEQEYADQLSQLQAAVNLEKLSWKEKYASGIIDKEEFSARIEAVEIAHTAKKLGVANAYKDGKNKATQDAVELETQYQNQVLDVHIRTNEAIAASDKNAAKSEEQILAEGLAKRQKHYAKIMEWAQVAYSAINTIISSAEAFVNNKEQREIEAEKRTSDKKRANLKKDLDAKRITQRQYDLSLAQMDKQQEKREQEMAIRQFKRQQAMQIGQVWMNAAMGIGGLLAQYAPGFPATLPIFAGMSALTLGMAGVQTGFIAAQKPPSYGKGGEVRKGGEIIGQSHSSGGVDINAEGGEYIVRNGPSQQYRPLLEFINGTRTMNVDRAISNIRQFGNGGPVPSGDSRNDRMPSFDALLDKVDQLTQEVKATRDKKVNFVKSDYDRFMQEEDYFTTRTTFTK